MSAGSINNLGTAPPSTHLGLDLHLLDDIDARRQLAGLLDLPQIRLKLVGKLALRCRKVALWNMLQKVAVLVYDLPLAVLDPLKLRRYVGKQAQRLVVVRQH